MSKLSWSINNFIKRLFDFFLALIGLVISSPLWAIISLLIYCTDKGPVFFLQERVGLHNTVFRLIKFRSMVNQVNGQHDLVDLKDDMRVTKIGKILRATAMDELPALLNILRGEMSFVGPKPLPMEIGIDENLPYTSMFQVPGYETRSQVKPGLTGIAQIYASKSVSRKEKFHYDNLYVRKRSVILDIKLLVVSFWVTFKGNWESREKKL